MGFYRTLEDTWGKRLINEPELQGRTIKRIYIGNRTVFNKSYDLLTLVLDNEKIYQCMLSPNVVCQNTVREKLTILDDPQLTKQFSELSNPLYEAAQKDKRYKEYLNAKTKYEQLAQEFEQAVTKEARERP